VIRYGCGEVVHQQHHWNLPVTAVSRQSHNVAIIEHYLDVRYVTDSCVIWTEESIVPGENLESGQSTTTCNYASHQILARSLIVEQQVIEGFAVWISEA